MWSPAILNDKEDASIKGDVFGKVSTGRFSGSANFPGRHDVLSQNNVKTSTHPLRLLCGYIANRQSLFLSVCTFLEQQYSSFEIQSGGGCGILSHRWVATSFHRPRSRGGFPRASCKRRAHAVERHTRSLSLGQKSSVTGVEREPAISYVPYI